MFQCIANANVMQTKNLGLAAKRFDARQQKNSGLGVERISLRRPSRFNVNDTEVHRCPVVAIFLTALFVK